MNTQIFVNNDVDYYVLQLAVNGRIYITANNNNTWNNLFEITNPNDLSVPFSITNRFLMTNPPSGNLPQKKAEIVSQKQQLTVYPNPTTGVVIIAFGDTPQFKMLQ